MRSNAQFFDEAAIQAGNGQTEKTSAMKAMKVLNEKQTPVKEMNSIKKEKATKKATKMTKKALPKKRFEGILDRAFEALVEAKEVQTMVTKVTRRPPL